MTVNQAFPSIFPQCSLLSTEQSADHLQFTYLEPSGQENITRIRRLPDGDFSITHGRIDKNGNCYSTHILNSRVQLLIAYWLVHIDYVVPKEERDDTFN